jgi:hypothetical protein
MCLEGRIGLTDAFTVYVNSGVGPLLENSC